LLPIERMAAMLRNLSASGMVRRESDSRTNLRIATYALPLFYCLNFTKPKMYET